MGTAEVAGFDVIDDSVEVRRRVGYMPETIPLYMDMTVFDYLMYMARLRHLRDAEDRLDKVLVDVSMQDRADGYISNLSKGMRQRVGLAQALLHDPQVLILDEPTIGLDPVQIVEVRNMIRSLGQERTIMLSTHILSEAQQLCDRVLIINNGQIVAEDTTERLQARLIGANRVWIEIAGDADGVSRIVEKVPGVARVISHNQDKLEFETIPGKDPRSDVARALVSEGYDLLEIRQVGMSLEDIFVQLTRDEPNLPEMMDMDDPNKQGDDF
jgi:ABC-2 type transport system ATP-binding protein